MVFVKGKEERPKSFPSPSGPAILSFFMPLVKNLYMNPKVQEMNPKVQTWNLEMVVVSKLGISFSSKGPPFSGEPCLFWGVYLNLLQSICRSIEFLLVVHSQLRKMHKNAGIQHNFC